MHSNYAPIVAELKLAGRVIDAELACGIAAWVYNYVRAWNRDHDKASRAYAHALNLLEHGAYIIEMRSGTTWERVSYRPADLEAALKMQAQLLPYHAGIPVRVRFDVTASRRPTPIKMTKKKIASILTLANLS
jgi:hypothetical protein